jgi:hypothetical protein
VRESAPLVFVTGDFSSGTTLVFNIFRSTRSYHCLYEPLHGQLLEYLVWPLPVDPHHPNTSSYFREYRGFRRIPHLYDPEWGRKDLFLPPEAEVPGLSRYLDYLVQESLARRSAVMFKVNRFGFRLGWLRRRFPDARIVHVRRDLDSQWGSLVRRAQENHGRADVGQESVHFSSFRMGAICDDLAPTFGELAASANGSGYERFARLWRRSDAEQSRWADLTVELRTLQGDLPTALDAIGRCVGTEFDPVASAAILARGPKRRGVGPRERLLGGVNRLGRSYAKMHVKVRSRWLGASLES